MMKYLIVLIVSTRLFADGLGYTGTGFAPTENFEYSGVSSIQTTDATQTVIHNRAMPDNSAWMIQVGCQGKKTDNSKREGFKKAALLYRAGGGAAVEGNIVNFFEQPAVTYDMTVGVNGNSFEILVTGAASETVAWTCTYCLQKLE
jgi:hypothetical protein